MKYLILFLLSFNLYAAVNEVVVTRISNGKLIAQDTGEGVSIESVKDKMFAKKGIDITDATKFSITVTDRTQEVEDERQSEIDAKTERQAMRAMIQVIKADTSISNDVQKVLVRVMKDLYK